MKKEDETLQYYLDDPEIPVYSQVTVPYGCDELVDILLSNVVDKEKICVGQPLAVDSNMSFVINLDSVPFNDLKADDMGTWKSTGTKHTYFHFNKHGEVIYKPLSHFRNKVYYNLTRRYYVHGTCSTFHRLIVSIEGMFNMYISLIVMLH